MARKLDENLQAERRRQVLDAAMECFRRSGFRGASVSEICHEAGMSPGHLYHYFENKEAIVEAICRRDLERVLTRVTAVRDADEFTAALVEIGVDEVTQGLGRHAAFFHDILAEASRNPRVAAVLARFDEMVEAQLGEKLRAAQMGGQLGTKLDLAGAVVEMRIIAHGFLARAAASPGFDNPVNRALLRRMLTRALTG